MLVYALSRNFRRNNGTYGTKAAHSASRNEKALTQAHKALSTAPQKNRHFQQ